MIGRCVQAVAIAAILVGAAAASGATGDTSLPRQGGTTSEQAFATRECSGDDEYLAGMHGGTSWDVLRTFIGGIVQSGGVVNGVRTVGIACRQILDRGNASGPVDEGDVAGFPVEPVFNVFPPSYRDDCSLRNFDGTVTIGVVNGFYGWVEPGDKGFIRTLGLGCMLIDGSPGPAIQTPLSADVRSSTPDFSIDCPQRQAAVGLRLGLSELRAPFDPRDLMSVQLICRAYLRAPDFVTTLGPSEGTVVDQRSGARFRWSPVARAVLYRVCATVLSAPSCRRTSGTSLPVDDLVGSAAVGRRFAWSVGACALQPKIGSTVPRICGPVTSVPIGGESDPLAIRFAPRRVTSLKATPGTPTFSNSSPVRIELGFQGQPLASRYRIRLQGVADFPQQTVEEGSAAGAAHQVELVVPVKIPTSPGKRLHALVLQPTLQACAGEVGPGREVCGSEVRSNAVVADPRTGRVCLLSRRNAVSHTCSLPAPFPRRPAGQSKAPLPRASE
jgi:hypothetical protein